MKYQRLKLQHRDGRVTFWAGPVQIHDDDPFEVSGGAASPPFDLPATVTIDDKGRVLPDDKEELKPRPSKTVRT